MGTCGICFQPAPCGYSQCRACIESFGVQDNPATFRKGHAPELEAVFYQRQAFLDQAVAESKRAEQAEAKLEAAERQIAEAMTLLADDLKREELDMGLRYCVATVLERWQGASDDCEKAERERDEWRELADRCDEVMALRERAEKAERELDAANDNLGAAEARAMVEAQNCYAIRAERDRNAAELGAICVGATVRPGEQFCAVYGAATEAVQSLLEERDSALRELEKARALLKEAFDHGLNSDWMDRARAFDGKS